MFSTRNFAKRSAASILAFILIAAFLISAAPKTPKKAFDSGSLLLAQGGLQLMEEPSPQPEMLDREQLAALEDSLPSSYNSIAQGYGTPVKNQASDGTCVVYASTAMQEIFLKKMTGRTYDLSENHTKYTLSSQAYYDGINYYGYNRKPSDGTSYGQLITYLFNGRGPVLESQSPYVWGDDQVSRDSLESLKSAVRYTKIFHLDGTSDKASWIAMVKDYIYRYGSVAIAIDFQDAYFDRTGKYMYDYRSSRGVNHAVLLVGWDDNMAASNFANKNNGTTPPSNGGFIVRNSWGSGWADGGYFYLSYNNCTISETDCLVVGDFVYADNDQTVNTYAEYGRTSSLGYGSVNSTWFANKFYLGANEYVTLDQVGFYSVNDNMPYEIYLSPTGSVRTSEMTLIASGTTDRYGYYNITIPSSITLGSSSESAYTVAVRVFASGNGYPIPIESANGETGTVVSSYISYTKNGKRTIAPNTSEVTNSLNSQGISYSQVDTGYVGYEGFDSLSSYSNSNIVVTAVTSPADAAATLSIPGTFGASSYAQTSMQDNSSYLAAASANAFAEYSVNVASAGTYALTVSMTGADYNAARKAYVYMDGSLIGTFDVENTESATHFLDHKLFVNIPSAGQQTLRIVTDAGVSIQNMVFEKTSPATHTVPGSFAAIDYADQKGVVVNQGSVEYLNDGDTFTYNIDVLNAGDYYLTVNAASATSGSSATVSAIKNNLVYGNATVNVPNSGGWETYTDTSAVVINLTSGIQQLKFTVGTGFNINSINLTAVHRTAGKLSAYNRIEAEHCDSKSGMVAEGRGQSGSGNLGGVVNGNYAVYEGVNFGGGASSAVFGASVTANGGYVEIHADSADGTLLGTCQFTSTGNWETWGEFTCDITNPVTGIHDVYLVFKTSGGYVCNLDWFRFNAKTVSAYNKIEAESTDDYSYLIKVENYGENGGGNVGNTENGLFTAYRNVDFGSLGCESVHFRVSATSTAAGTIEIRLGSRTGTLIGSCSTQSTGGWSNWTDVTCPVAATTGVHDVYLVYVPASGKAFVANIEWFRFEEIAQSGPATGITLYKNGAAVANGGSETVTGSASAISFTAAVTPVNAENKNYTITVNNSSVATVNGNTATITPANATADTSVTITATSADGGFTASYTVNIDVQTNPVTNLAATATQAKATLTWTASSNATGYKIYKNNTLIDTVSSTSYTATGLTAGTTYSFSVVATGVNGDSAAVNVSATTSPASQGGGGDNHGYDVAYGVGEMTNSFPNGATVSDIVDSSSFFGEFSTVPFVIGDVWYNTYPAGALVFYNGAFYENYVNGSSAWGDGWQPDINSNWHQIYIIDDSTPANIPAAGITLYKSGTAVANGGSVTVAGTASAINFTAAVTPDNASNQNYTITVSNSSVASVNGGTATVTPANAAADTSVIITATSADGGFTASYTVNIDVEEQVEPDPELPDAYVFEIGNQNAYWTTYDYGFTCDVPCQFVAGSTYVPFRVIAQAAGARSVNYDSSTGKVTLVNSMDMTFELFVDSKQCAYSYGGQSGTITLNSAPVFIDGACCLPIRDISNLTFANVEFTTQGLRSYVLVSSQKLTSDEISACINSFNK